MRSLERHYAQTAYQAISKLEGQPGAAEYGRLCHAFPSMVLLNGLRLTVAFFESKSGKDKNAAKDKADGSDKQIRVHRQYLEDMAAALELGSLTEALNGSLSEGNEYRILSRNALKASVWFKRYAEAILKVTQADDQDIPRETMP